MKGFEFSQQLADEEGIYDECQDIAFEVSHIFTVKDFGAMLLIGAMNSYDGEGYFIVDGVEDRSASIWESSKIPEGCTHISWYDK